MTLKMPGVCYLTVAEPGGIWVHSSSARIHGDASGIVMKNSTKSITGLVGDAEVISYYIINGE